MNAMTNAMTSGTLALLLALSLSACGAATDKQENASNPSALTGTEDGDDASDPTTGNNHVDPSDDPDGCGEDCPDPDDPRVTYASEDPEICMVVEFECEQGAAYFDDECGCGCILPDDPTPTTCPDADDPAVTYASHDPEVCMAADLICPDGAAYFDNECGCGCIAGD